MDVGQHLVRAGQQDVEPLPGGFVGQRLGQMTLADSGLPTEQDVAVLAHKLAGRQIEDLLAVDTRVEAEVEGLQGLGGVDAAAADTEFKLFVTTTFHFILDEPNQKLLTGPLLTNGLLNTHGQRVEDAGEPQPFEVGCEADGTHRTPPNRLVTNSLACRTKV